MPVFKSGPGRAPAWCELDYFEIVRLIPGDTHTFKRTGEKEKLLVGAGLCRVTIGDTNVEAELKTNLDIRKSGEQFEISDVREDTTLIRMVGRWGDVTGGSGIFTSEGREHYDAATDPGDPPDYPKTAVFDNHYHDCDEYWIVFEGSGVAVSEGKLFEVSSGDCVLTGMGHHHDFPVIGEPYKCAYFETTMEGQKRPGHLWNHTHGPAEPRTERV